MSAASKPGSVLRRFGGFLLSGVVVLAVIACGVIGTLLLVAHTDSKKDSQFARLQAAANAACGTDRTLGVTWHPSGFARRESFATHCRKPNGEVYVVVTQK